MSPIIIEGGGGEPLVTTKRRKQEVYYAPQWSDPVTVTANLRNLNAAHFQLNGTYASPDKAMTLLGAAGDRPRTVEDWKELLDPDTLLNGITGLPSPEEVEYEAAKRTFEAQREFEPSALEERKRGEEPAFLRTQWRGRVKKAVEDEEDFDPVLDVRERLETYSSTGKPSELLPAPNRDLGKVEDTCDYIRRAQRELADRDVSPADLARHDVMAADLTGLAREVAARRTELGLTNNFDPENPHGRGLVDAYREMVAMRYVPDAIIGDPQQQADALKAISSLYQLRPGEDPADIVNAVAGFREILTDTGVTNENVLKLCYESWVAGRPFGQSNDKAMWDYVFRYGREYLPAEAAKRAAEMEQNIGTFMAGVQRVMDPGGVVSGAMDVAEKVIYAPFAVAAKPLEWIEQATYGDHKAASALTSVAHWFSEGVSHFDVVSLVEHPLITAANMFDLVVGGSSLKDGTLQSEGLKFGEEGKFDPGVIFRAEAWQASWDAGEGKMLVGELARHLSESLGVEGDVAASMQDIAIMVDYGIAIFAGAKVDAFAMPVAKGAAIRGYFETRRMLTPERMARLRTALADQRGSFQIFSPGDYPDSDAVLRGIIRRSNEARAKGEKFDLGTAARDAVYELNVRDRARARKLAEQGKGAAPKVSEAERLASEGAPIVYRDGTYVVGDMESYHKWYDDLQPVVRREMVRRQSLGDLFHEELLEMVEPGDTTPWARVRIQEIDGRPGIWFTSSGPRAVDLDTVLQIATDLKKNGLVKDSYWVQGVYEAQTVGDLLKLAEQNGVRPQPHSLLTSGQFLKTKELLDQIPDEAFADVTTAEEGVSGQQVLVTEGERIVGDTQLDMGAIDQDVVAPKAQPKAGAEAQTAGATDEELAATQAAIEAERTQADIAFDELPVEEARDGVKVKETSVGRVDASIAADIELLNREGYKTFGSHGYPEDHPKAHPARDIDPYVEFDKADLVRAADDIAAERESIEAELAELADRHERRAAAAELAAKAEVDAPKTADELMKWLRMTRIDRGASVESFIDKTLGGDRLAPYRRFRGTLASKKQPSAIGGLDEVAAYVGEHFPWFGIRSDDDLFTFITDYEKGKGLPGVAADAARTKELTARLGQLDSLAGRANDRLRAIVRAAKKTGMKLESSTADGRTLVLVRGKNLHDFVEALTGKPVDPSSVLVRKTPPGLPSGGPAALLPGDTRWFRGVGGPRPPVAQEPPLMLGRPNTAGRYNPLLWNRAEVIAYRLTDPEKHGALLATLFRIPDDPVFHPFIDELIAASDPETVLSIIERSRSVGMFKRGFDPLMPGLYDLVRAAGYTTKLRSGPSRLLHVPVGLGGRHVPATHSERVILNLGWAYKMGRKEWTQADRDLCLRYATRALRAPRDERMHIVNEFCKVIEDNMRAEGTWAKYERFADMVRKMHARAAAREFGRAYTKGSRVVPAGYTKNLMGEIRFWERQILELTDEGRLKEAKAALAAARRELLDYREAADIINGKVTKFENGHDMAWARDRMDALASPTPLLAGEMADTIRLPWNPRTMAWFHAGTPARALVWVDAHGFDALMRAWKMYVMSALSFPFRVFGKDEGLRMISEGIIPGGQRWREMIVTRRELFGSRKLLSDEENKELDSLLAASEATPDALDAEQLERLAELKGKAEGRLTAGERLLVEDEGGMNWAESGFTGDYVLVSPGEAGHIPAFAKHLRKLHDEPVVRLFLKTDLKTKEEIRAWLSSVLTSKNEEGTALRLLLFGQDRITKGQMRPQEMRRLLASSDRTGSAANVRAFLDDMTDICYAIGVDPRLRKAVKRPGSVPHSELEKVNKKLLWPVPTTDRVVLGNGVSGLSMPRGRTYNPLRLFYEHVTLRYMEGISKQLRRSMFADGYVRELRALTEAGVEPQLAHRIAFERGLDYCNSVTFTRNPTVMEDLLRNYVPFVNSYRQFWLYWAKVLARHPFAVSATYNLNPAKDQFGVRIPGADDYLFFGLPMGTFWMEQPGGLGGVMKGNLPNVNPWIALLASGVGSRLGVDLDSLLGQQGDNALSPSVSGPYSSFKALAFGLGFDSKTAQLLFGEMGGYEKQHAYLLKEYAAGKGKPVPVSGEVEVDWPFWVDVADKLTLGHADRPEFVLQGLTRIVNPLGTQKLSPRRTEEVMDGMRLIGDPDAVAKYRATHPDFDLVQRYYEGSVEEKVAIAEKAPWVVDYSAPVSSYGEGVFTFTTPDYIKARERGDITTPSDEDVLRSIAARRIQHWGGYRKGDPREVKPFMSRKAAEKEMKAQLQYARDWAQSVAKSVAGGNTDFYNALMAQWKSQGGERLPGIFREYARREAEAKGIDFDTYERTLCPDTIGKDFVALYGSDYLLTAKGAQDSDVQHIMTLIGAGLGTASQARWWIANTSYPEAIQAAIEDTKQKTLKGLADTASEEYFDLDSGRLREVGVRCGPAIDLAITKVRKYYYDTYKPVVDKYGSSSREARDARLAYNAFRDATLSRVKGGEALVGGLADRIVHIPYFTRPNYASVASGHHAAKEQGIWNAYIREAQKLKPDMKKIEEYHKHFTPYVKERYQEFMRVNHMLYAAAMARYLRQEMKESYSDYYEGPGNSAYSTLGQKMVARLSGLIRGLIAEDKKRWGASAFAKDIYGYFTSPHAFAFTALEWGSH